MYEKEIRYEPEHANQGGFCCYLDGVHVATCWNYADADLTLDELIHNLVLNNYGTAEATPPHQPATRRAA